MIFDLAIQANIPIISVRTNDTINIETVLEEFTDKTVLPFRNGDRIKKDTVYYYINERVQLIAIDALYRELQNHDSCIVVINPQEEHPAFYNAGLLPVPKKTIIKFLREYLHNDDIPRILPALGGLSLKDMADVLLMTSARDGGISTGGILKSRKYAVGKIQGIDLVDTTLSSYMPDARLKKYAKEQKLFFLNGPDVRLCPRGIIAFGTPGTGKSQGAKFLASEWGVPLYRLDATLQSKYVGESESRLADALHHIEQDSPCILLIDEVEKLFGKEESDSSGVTQKLLGTLLWWLQEHAARVLVYMTCNNKDILPKELYRAGRIDEEIQFFGLKQPQALALGDFIVSSYPKLAKAPARASIRREIKARFRKIKRLSHAEIDSIVKKSLKSVIIAEKQKTNQ